MTHGADLSKETDPSAPEPMLSGRGDKPVCSVSSLERRQTLRWDKEGVGRGPVRPKGLTNGPAQDSWNQRKAGLQWLQRNCHRKLALQAGGKELESNGK